MSRGRRALALAALALTLSPAARGADAPRAARAVTLVPTPAGTAGNWRWTADCTLDPVAATGCGRGGPILGAAQLNGDEWNLGGPASAGSVDMSVAANGSVSIEGRFDHTPPCTDSGCLAPSAGTWVRGYPNVLYGIDQCRAGSSPRTSPRLSLPRRLDAIPPHLVGVTAYSARTADVTYDVTYDLWLQRSDTTRPCRTSGTLEILVMTDYGERALPPDSLRIGTAAIPFAAGTPARLRARPWSVYATNIGRDGWTQPWGGTLWFVPDTSDVVRRGRARVDLGAVLAEAGRILHDSFGWHALGQRYWLDTVAFGIEYGPPSGLPLDAGPSRFSAVISAYCLAPRMTVLRARCG